MQSPLTVGRDGLTSLLLNSINNEPATFPVRSSPVSQRRNAAACRSTPKLNRSRKSTLRTGRFVKRTLFRSPSTSRGHHISRRLERCLASSSRWQPIAGGIPPQRKKLTRITNTPAFFASPVLVALASHLASIEFRVAIFGLLRIF